MTIKTPNSIIFLDKKEADFLIASIQLLKKNANRYKLKTGEDAYYILACKLLSKLIKFKSQHTILTLMK